MSNAFAAPTRTGPQHSCPEGLGRPTLRCWFVSGRVARLLPRAVALLAFVVLGACSGSSATNVEAGGSAPSQEASLSTESAAVTSTTQSVVPWIDQPPHPPTPTA